MSTMSEFSVRFLLCLLALAASVSRLIDAQQRTHFPKPTGQTKVIQCPLNEECRSIVQCANQSELKLNPRKLNYCGWRHGLPMVCCAATKARNRLFERDDLVNPGLRQGLPKYKANLKAASPRKSKMKNFEICGTRIKQISMYIVGGSHVVSPTKYPWFASIALVKDESYLSDEDKEQKNSNLHHYCGSTILTDQFLISSAHCFPISGVDELDLANYRIALGDVELSSEKMQIHEIDQVLIHPNASTDHHYNDVALIKLKKRLSFSSRVRPVCLPFLDFGEYAESENTNDDQMDDNLRDDRRGDDSKDNLRDDKSADKTKKEDKEHGKRPEDDSNKFDSPEQNLQLFGFPNPNYQPNRESSFRTPFYGFANPNYRPNYNSNSGFQSNGEQRPRRPVGQRRYPYASPYSYNNFYPFRSKRSSGIQFVEYELYDELFTRPNVKVSIAGYGDTQFMGSRSPVLKEADLMIVNKEKCNELYTKLNSTSLRRGLTGEFVCAADKRLAKELNADLLDARTRRTKRSIKYWVNYFSERIREREEKRKNLSRSTDGDKNEKAKTGREESTEKLKSKLDKSASNKLELKKKDDDYDKDLVNVLSEEELREKLTGLSDACQGDSGGGMFTAFDVRTFNRTLSEHRGNVVMREKLKNKFEPIFQKLEKKGLEGKFYLTSIVAFGINCGSTPGVYVNLDYHKRWILDTIDLDDSKFRL